MPGSTLNKIKAGWNRRTPRFRKLASVSLGAVVITVVIFSMLSPAAEAAVTVGTSTANTATEYSQQRKTWYDGTRYWVAYYDNATSAIVFYYSADGTSWTQNTSATISTTATVKPDFSILADSTTAYIGYYRNSGSVDAIEARSATSYPGTSFAWSAATTVVSSPSPPAESYVSVMKDSNNKVRFMWQAKAANYTWNSKLSTNADDITALGSLETVDAATANSNKFGSLASLGSGDMYSVWIDGTTIEGKKNTAGTWDASPTSIATGTTGTSNNMSMVSNTSSGEAYLAYVDSSGNTVFQKYNGSWQTAVTLDSNAGNTNVSISINPANNDLYVFWIRSNTIYYKKGVSSYGSGSWDSNATTFVSTGSNTWLSSSYQASGAATSAIPVIWTDGTGSPWNVQYQALNMNEAPGAPTLSSPAQGATVVSTLPQLQMSATDADSDSIKYKVLIYNTSANDGTTCTGSSFETADQNSSGTGWDNGTTAYTSGATATYTTQTTMTRGNSYCWQAQAKDPSGSNTFGGLSTPYTFTVDSIPDTPTLVTPASSATNVSVLPQFTLRTTDVDSDYLQYYIQLYDATACGGSLVRTIDQTSSQTGWQGQDVTSTAYRGAPAISGSTVAVHSYQPSPLVPNHLYSWRAKAIDPGGANTFSSLTSCQDFTTATYEVQIQGGTEIRGGTTIQ